MPARTNPPFRAEHLGSLLRPAKLIDAREAWMAGKLSREELRNLEDEAVRDTVAMQERVGLQVISDGEQRRSSWRDLCFEYSDGFGTKADSDFTFTQFSGEKHKGMPVPTVVARVKRREPMTVNDFAFVKKLTRRTVKAMLPTPSVNHFFLGDKIFAKSPYKSRAEYLADIAAIYRQEVADLAAAGCTYLQIDDVPLAVLCDPKNAALVKARGEDPEKLIDEYIELHNTVVRDRPKSMVLGVHLCRGNQGHGQASGGYEPVADRMFNRMDADVYFLEYDTERAGDFTPLRLLPRDRSVVLGLMSSKLPALEPEDELRRRIDAAAKFVDLGRLALSHQCGFASNYQLRRLTLDDQERKLAHMVAVAKKVWGSA